MAHDVLISYSSRDRRTADAVCAGLEAAGLRCWIAPRDIVPGQAWGAAIVDAIQASRIMVVVLSSASVASDQVLREVERAVHHTIPIVPFRIQDCELPSAFAYFLSVPHWLNATTGPLEAHIQQLVQTARALLGSPEDDGRPDLEGSRQPPAGDARLPAAGPPEIGRPAAEPPPDVPGALHPSPSEAGHPTGTVTFLFTDIEGSTQRWERSPAAMQAALARHDALLRRAIESHGGYVFKTIGDAFCAAFDRARDAVAAAIAVQRGVAATDWGEVGPLRVRIALHSGSAEQQDGDYFGPPLNRVARLLGSAHGGQTILSQSVSELARDALPPGAALRDLGEHHLRDLQRAERVFQLVVADLPAEFPPLRAPDVRPSNLPPQATPFVGRVHERAAIQQRLLSPDVRLLTLTGPGGTGKTRLAVQAAADVLDRFEHGVWFVPLAMAEDPEEVAAAIAQALGARGAPGRPAAETLIDALRERQLLLVLDNFEQAVRAASLVADLLRAAPRVKALVTSRAALRVYGEHEFPVPGLLESEAVRLFVERARSVRPDFDLTPDNAVTVAQICARLDGLPLAIELAAARARLLAPTAMLARMERRLPLLTGGARDLPARQQTLRGAIGWSYDLLDPVARQLFASLGVFAGGCTLDAAEAVAGNPLDPAPAAGPAPSVLDGLEALVGQSLLRLVEVEGAEPRFVMLETIREFALERLEAEGTLATRQRQHAAYFLALAGQAEREIRGPAQQARIEQLEREHDALQAELDWALERLEGGPLLPGSRASDAELPIDGWLYLLTRAARCLARAQQSLTELLGPRQRSWLQRLAEEHENLRAALNWALEHGEAETALRLGGTLWFFWQMHGDLREGRRRLEVALHQNADGLPGVEHYRQGLQAWADGDPVAALAAIQRSLAAFQSSGATAAAALALLVMARVAQEQGAYERAALAAQEGLRRSPGATPWYQAECLEVLAAAAAQAGAAERAARLAGASTAIRATLPESGAAGPGPSHPTMRAGLDQFAAAWAEGHAMPPDEALRYALRAE